MNFEKHAELSWEGCNFFPCFASAALARSSHSVVLINELANAWSNVPPWEVKRGARTITQSKVLIGAETKQNTTKGKPKNNKPDKTQRPRSRDSSVAAGNLCASELKRSCKATNKPNQTHSASDTCLCFTVFSTVLAWASAWCVGYRGSFGLCSAFCGLVHWWNCIVWSRALASGRRLGWPWPLSVGAPVVAGWAVLGRHCCS